MASTNDNPDTLPGAARAAGDSGSAANHAAQAPRVMRFRHFRVMPDTRSLFAGTQEIPIGSRVFDLLVVLLANQGSVVSKAELMRRVWPSLTVDESNLRFQMAALRRTLGPHSDLIRTIPGRGYFFARDAGDARCREVEGEGGDLTVGSAPARAGHYDELVRENLWLRRALSDLVLDRIIRSDPDNHSAAHA